jgi:hypothetical protein
MTTSGMAIPVSSDRSWSRADQTYASNRLAVAVLTMTFLLSFLQYCFERNDVVRLVPVALLIGGSILFLLTCSRERRRSALLTLVRPGTLALIAVVSIPPLFSSWYRPTIYPFEYGIVMVVALIAIRLLLSAVGLEGLLLAFFYATTAGVLIVVGLNFKDLLSSIGSTRYAPPYFDPNRIGYFAVTSIPAQLWYAIRRRRYYLLLVSALCAFVVLAASSRGSLGALLIGAAFVALLWALRLVRFSSLALSRNKLVGTLAFLCLVTAVGAADQPAIGDAAQYLSAKLALGTRDRGLNSGFTGRSVGWAAVLDTLPKTSWFLGNGYRTTDEDFGFSVDNGYLSELYEVGLLSISVILVRYALILYVLCSAYLWSDSVSEGCILAFIFTLVIFFSNAFVHRVLFGYGEQASILVLFAFVATREDVLAALRSPFSDPATVRAR